MNWGTKKRLDLMKSGSDRGQGCISRLELVLLSAGIWLGNLIIHIITNNRFRKNELLTRTAKLYS